MENTEKKPPIKVFRCGPVKAAVWLKTLTRDGQKIQVHSVSLQKSYRDKDSGEWKNTDRLYLDDLPRAAMVLTEAWRHYGVSTNEPRAQSDETGDGPVEDLNDEMNPE